MDDDSGEMISIISTDEDLKGADIPDILPILPIRNTVLFPGVVIPITVGRQKSIKLVKKSLQRKPDTGGGGAIKFKKRRTYF